MRIIATAVRLALSFVRERTPESCTRLCAVLCCLTGCTAAIATVAFAFVNPLRAPTVGALVGVTSALIAAGCVALLTRTRATCVFRRSRSAVSREADHWVRSKAITHFAPRRSRFGLRARDRFRCDFHV